MFPFSISVSKCLPKWPILPDFHRKTPEIKYNDTQFNILFNFLVFYGEDR